MFSVKLLQGLTTLVHTSTNPWHEKDERPFPSPSSPKHGHLKPALPRPIVALDVHYPCILKTLLMPITQATNHEKWKEKTQQSTLNINWCNRKNPASSKTKYFKKLTLRFIKYRLVHLLPCQQAYQGFQFWRGTWRHYWGPTGNRTNPCFFVYRGAKRIHIQDDVILVKLVQVLSGSLQTTAL